MMIAYVTPAKRMDRRRALAALHVRPARHRERQTSWVLLPDPVTVPRIRRQVRRQLDAWKAGTCCDVVELLVSEVVTNAMRHSWGAVMTVSLDERTLRCEVQDTNPAMPQMRQAHEGDEGGRGMILMEALSRDWGSYGVPAGKVVWFEISLDEEDAAA
ncbi:ATP-binding protein [Sphaerisporangium corydalis]|uniref:ATP-binding protein n=1 Tax=Sphaerisporangium corydalis TaxID=1441875 RepID=A0ABV9ELQ7_9ACTN|nr:ATP-binding protein [Sphaerisporangium corydalis]